MKGRDFLDKNSDYNYYGMPPFSPNGMGYDMGMDSSMNNMDTNAMFNPFMQYEQAYMYYRYLSMQMEYKIKCREYEKLTSKPEISRDFGKKLNNP